MDLAGNAPKASARHREHTLSKAKERLETPNLGRAFMSAATQKLEGTHFCRGDWSVYSKS